MIHSIVGLMSSGKTLYMTYLLYKDYLRGRTIITNYNVNFPHYEINKDFLINMAIQQPNLKGVSFGFDELWIWLDCRDSMSNKVATYFFLQSSKGDTRIYLSAQDEGQNEMRIRRNKHLITTCERRLLIDKKMRKISSEQRILPIEYQPYLYIKIRTYTQTFFGMERDFKIKEEKYIKANTIFPLYDTNLKMKMVIA